ncbi:hypothetical protein BCV69DRAFT_26438 [Microstroma glucosiphilum]|uniref:Uncharacterized protein n=1 Tax=Pseudomicrostroma glucosiphilum TaxID=1684307 RepID=A0A316U2Q2_9BASI|nr:hypothetical protein BCV69DRAFT_26438 [Pseudomicrostroma glucosiphilum]PWN19619.1 hypothetical protein BCV69DRAFT_26438 [Pseudomicrostroma glucosiphilum]
MRVAGVAKGMNWRDLQDSSAAKPRRLYKTSTTWSRSHTPNPKATALSAILTRFSFSHLLIKARVCSSLGPFMSCAPAFSFCEVLSVLDVFAIAKALQTWIIAMEPEAMRRFKGEKRVEKAAKPYASMAPKEIGSHRLAETVYCAFQRLRRSRVFKEPFWNAGCTAVEAEKVETVVVGTGRTRTGPRRAGKSAEQATRRSRNGTQGIPTEEVARREDPHRASR